MTIDPPDAGRRRFFDAMLTTAAIGMVGVTSMIDGSPTRFDAVVSRRARDGVHAPIYDSVAEAIAAAPRGRAAPWRVRIAAGRWNERLVIDRADVHLIGDDARTCRIGSDAAAGQRAPDGEPWGTWRCASVIVRAPGFRAHALTIENRFDYVGHLRDPVFEPIGSNGAQAVALMLDRGADRVVLTDCDIVGHQDTLFVDAGRSWFRDCRIRGSVDFVFGAGDCVLERCTLVSRHRPGKPVQGYIAAPSTLSSQARGLLFHRCELHRDPGVARGSVALGRPWRPTRDFSDGRYGDPAVVGSASFVDCWMDEHIDPAGWHAMAYTARDGTRPMFDPRDARLSEYRSRGPGAVVSATRPQIAVSVARPDIAPFDVE